MDRYAVELLHLRDLKNELVTLINTNESLATSLQNDIWKTEIEIEYVAKIIDFVEDQGAERKRLLTLRNKVDNLKLQHREVSSKKFHDERKKIQALDSIIVTYIDDED